MSFRPFRLCFFVPNFKFAILAALLCLAACATRQSESARAPLAQVRTLAGAGDARLGEAFGIVVDKNGTVFASDGAGGKIRRIERGGATSVLTDRLDTPSAITIDKDSSLLVADAGSHTIKRINLTTGETSVVAGVENKFGFADGAATEALFNAPVGVAAAGDKIFVADSYNDRVRVIENGTVKTIAGGERGFADNANGLSAKFNTPCGVAVAPGGDVIVADTGNRRIRRIAAGGGAVTTFAGTGEGEARDGWSWQAAFVEPVGVAVDGFGAIYVADAGANQIRVFGRRFAAPLWETIAGTKRGTIDGALSEAKFNRPTNTAIDASGNLFVADSANKLVRVVQSENEKIGNPISAETWRNLFLSPEQMRSGGEPRWTFDPPAAPRDIAGTFGEVRGAIRAPGDDAWFHNGLDVAGALGETARFIRPEKVLRPLAVEDFDQKNNRERLRMPTVGYIHIRLGRDAGGKPFDDERFLFERDAAGKLKDLRVRRGAKFAAGEAVGTLNPFNHVHLIAGETGAEMNAFAGLILPGARDALAPTIEKVILYDENWRELKPAAEPLRGRVRIVARAFDRMDGGSARRRLGVYRLGYQILNRDDSIAAGFDNPPETISFERLPDNEFANLVYAVGSQSGYTPDTVFNYIVSNIVRDGAARENFLDPTKLPTGDYKIRVFAWDYFGNQATQDLNVKTQN